MATVAVAGCEKPVPVELAKLKVPSECKAKPPADLPAVAKVSTKKVGPDGVNKHWARHWRLQARPAYRRLRHLYRVCSSFAAQN